MYDLHSYDTYLVAFSGGKDSIASFLYLLDQGIPPEKIELWHHEIDGREGTSIPMDWPYVPAYCRQFAKVFGIPIYFSWKEGGFAREMMRQESSTAPTWFETPDGLKSSGGKGPKGTRRKFPQVSADLRVRWCSAYLKIDVMDAAIRGQKRFLNSRTLVVTGERSQESPARSRYAQWNSGRTNSTGRLGRVVDHHRPIHNWSETQVWDQLKLYGVIPPPAYRLGWGRLSCMFCIFGNKNQWASAKAVDPDTFKWISNAEDVFGVTIHRSKSVEELASEGTPYFKPENPVLRKVRDPNWCGPILCLPSQWRLPSGAFGDSNGPT